MTVGQRRRNITSGAMERIGQLVQSLERRLAVDGPSVLRYHICSAGRVERHAPERAADDFANQEALCLTSIPSAATLAP